MLRTVDRGVPRFLEGPSFEGFHTLPHPTPQRSKKGQPEKQYYGLQ